MAEIFDARDRYGYTEWENFEMEKFRCFYEIAVKQNLMIDLKITLSMGIVLKTQEITKRYQ